MKTKGLKEKIIFCIIAVIAAGFVLCTALIGTKKYYPIEGVEGLHIVFLGDSNLAYEREGKTIPHRVNERMGATVYNCSVGGTTAAKLNKENHFDARMDQFCLYNIIKILEASDHEVAGDFYGDKNPREIDAIRKMEMLVNIDMEQVDYVVIAYGLNDYMIACPVEGENPYDEETYAGALRNSIETIQKVSPNTKIIVSSVTYCYYEQEDGTLKDGYEYSWGAGTIDEYRDVAREVADEYENVYFIDNLSQLDINEKNCMEYVDDGIHLSEAGQEMYAENLVSVIEEIESGSYE